MSDSTTSFKKISIFKRLTMPLSELEPYYCALRKYRFEQGEKLSHFRMRRMVQPLLVRILMLERFSKKHTLTVTGKRSAYAKNVIYYCPSCY